MKVALVITVYSALGLLTACSTRPENDARPPHAGNKPHALVAMTDSELQQFVTVPPDALPDGVRLVKDIRSVPVGPNDENPDVLKDPQRIQLLAQMMGFGKAAFVEHVQAGVVAIYEHHSQPAPNEIGVWGLYFTDRAALASATQAMERLRGTYKSWVFLRKGPLLLTIWSDVEGDQRAIRAMESYFKAE